MRSPPPPSRRRSPLGAVLPPLCVALLAIWHAAAAIAASTPPANAIANGGFEGGSRTVDNLWDGVDGDGYLCGFRFSAIVVTDNGNLGGLAMPPSVAFADLHGDGKPGLLTADPTGFFHFYPNHGTAAEPRFGYGELVPLYLSGASRAHKQNTRPDLADAVRFCPRFSLADWRQSGVLDLLVGNFFGETFFIPNTGTSRAPAFRQPTGQDGIGSARLPTSESHPFWGNLLSPAAIDLDRHGKLDLLLGEGTYSANSIHLLRNVSNGGVPRFTDAQHSHIAYGDGREQLIPTVVDYDGDGNPDILVADRTGEIGVYLNPGKSPGPQTEFKRVATISLGGSSKLPGLCSICAADFNGDGLFDLILGMSNGHVAVSLNTGTKTNPAFGPIQELKGEDRLPGNVILPDRWDTATYSEAGNVLGYFCVVDAKSDPASAPPEGTHCLKAGYWPLPGETFKVPPEGIAGAEKHFKFEQPGITLDNNKTYELSFRVKATGIERMHYKFESHYESVAPSQKIVRGERGDMKNQDAVIRDWVEIGENFSAGSHWSHAGGTMNIHHNNPALHDQPTMTGTLSIEFWATSLAASAYFDDFQLVQKQ